MNLKDDLHYYADPDAICIWWEKPEEADLIDVYTLNLDGQPKGETKNTHFTFEDLESEREYTIQVTSKNAEGLLLDDVTLHICTPAPKKSIIVTEAPYCAKGDSITKNTEALQRAIDDCPEGGSVVIPEGTFLTGALFLHSGMELYIDEGAVLLGSPFESDYLPLISARFNGKQRECYAALLNIGSLDHREGPLCHNVTIRGKGTIKGAGSGAFEAEPQKELYSAGLINISNCSNVRISSLTLSDAPGCCVHITFSLNTLTDHCVFRQGDGALSCGWVPDSSESCTLFACTFFTGGDSISIRSGKDSEGIRIARPTRKIRIFDCRCMSGEGIHIGTEIAGGVENVRIWDGDLERSSAGIQVTGTKNGGGYVRGVRVQDCVTPRLKILPASLDAGAAESDDCPDLGNLLYERILITGRSLKKGEWRECRSVEMEGFDRNNRLHDVLLKDINIQGGLGVHTEFCERLAFEEEKGDES